MNDLVTTLATSDIRAIRDSSALVTVHALDCLAELVDLVRDHNALDDRESVAGALLEIEEKVEDIRAALRLRRIAGSPA